MSSLHRISIAELKDRLLAQLDSLVHRFAPPAADSWTKGSLYYTTNPGRADRRSGSFVIHMSGGRAGKWHDYSGKSEPASGDVLDLIGLSLGLRDNTQVIKAAREWLGLDTEDDTTRRAREAHSRRMKLERERRAAEEDQAREKRQNVARMVWFSAEAIILDTPVDHYLRGRGIDLRALPHVSGAIRFAPSCRYYHDEVVDPETGEVLAPAGWRPMPAMVTAITLGSKIIDCHRTYLAQRPDGSWGKAAIEDAKKVFGDYTGGGIRLCGSLGPRGGQIKLNDAPEGAEVWIPEGIENGLSLIALRALTNRPPAFVVAAGAIFNFARIQLPPAVKRVVLVADNDSGDQAQLALANAEKFHTAQGRTVRIWRSRNPGEDLNDALQRALKEGAA